MKFPHFSAALSALCFFFAFGAISTVPHAPEPEIAYAMEQRGELVRIHIPSIALVSPVIGVGLNDAGEMDVPRGDTNNVGWYEQGTVPGERGSAVMDAHVYAAFKNLHRAKAGDEIYIEKSNGEKLRFVISETLTYALDDVPRELLFARADDERLNLITCAGAWDAVRNTYDHRLIVYARLAE